MVKRVTHETRPLENVTFLNDKSTLSRVSFFFACSLGGSFLNFQDCDNVRSCWHSLKSKIATTSDLSGECRELKG